MSRDVPERGFGGRDELETGVPPGPHDVELPQSRGRRGCRRLEHYGPLDRLNGVLQVQAPRVRLADVRIAALQELAQTQDDRSGGQGP